MGRWINVSEVLTMGAYLYPDKIAAKDLSRSTTYDELNERCNRLANGLFSLGLKKGDRVAAIAYNCLEWIEIYGAAAKAGLIAVPIMFRLTPTEYQYILQDSEAKALILDRDFIEGVDSIKNSLPDIPPSNYLILGEGEVPGGYQGYETMINNADASDPEVEISNDDIWVLSYTSGTTGMPKGALRSHESYIALFLSKIVELKFLRDDIGLMVMPMCHFNSIMFSYTFLYTYGTAVVYDRKSFDPEHLLKTIADEKITFTSLVPTHYIMMLGLPDEVKGQYDVSCIRTLLCSSAPARRDTKEAILNYFKNANLFEVYGSTEGGIGTTLRPEDMMWKLGSIGKEIIGMSRIKILDDAGNEVPTGEVGELHTKGPTVFSGYWKRPDETEKAFRGEYICVGDMGKKDEDGFYYLVDRKQNMIISGGENVYPSEVENVVGAHSAVKDVAIIGVPDTKWGEAVKAIVVLKGDAEESEDLKEDIMNYCRGKIAGYKRPKSIDFIQEANLPRTATGKILHRILRSRYGTWSEE